MVASLVCPKLQLAVRVSMFAGTVAVDCQQH